MMAMIFVHGKLPDVPEEDIQEVIKIVNEWFAQHPEHEDCNPQIFGHHTWNVRRGHVEEDVRAGAAARTHSYTKT
jgi:hypothetical protein